MKRYFIRSPFFYVGDKYKLMPQICSLFPENIETYIEPFAGGGSSFLNTNAKHYLVNDINFYVVELHKFLTSYAWNEEEFFKVLYDIIDKYGFSCSYRGITAPNDLKKKYIKTYYSHYNKCSYIQLREDFNREKNMFFLYLLLIYGFNHMLRFNSAGKFNLPVGNVDFNGKVYNAICDYFNFMKNRRVDFYNVDFVDFLEFTLRDIRCENLYIYFDPPYLISGSEYNKYWNEFEERKLCDYLDYLNYNHIRFGVSNLVRHKGRINSIFLKWSKDYLLYHINSNYISFNDNTIKSDSEEVFVTNYENK